MATTTNTNLTANDITKVINDDRHLGFGVAEIQHMSEGEKVNFIAEVVRMANEAGWSYEDLFAWGNSKLARWCCDCRGTERNIMPGGSKVNLDELR
jgi:hypothetical protein